MKGLITALNNLDEREIEGLIKKLRRKHPRSKVKDWKLRSYAVNTLMHQKMPKFILSFP